MCCLRVSLRAPGSGSARGGSFLAPQLSEIRRHPAGVPPRRAAVVLCALLLLPAPPALRAGNGAWTTSYPFGGNLGSSNLALDPSSPGTLYAAPLWRGLYRSSDGAATWSPLLDDAPAPFDNKHLAGLTVPPAGGALYLIAFDWMAGRQRLFASTDGGATWNVVDVGTGENLTAVAFAPSDPAVVYAGTRQGEAWRSSDGGATWSLIGNGLPADEVRSLEVDPTDPDTVYLGTFGNGLFKTTDGGATWANAGGGMTTVEDVAVDPGDPLTLYAADNDPTTGKGIFRSTDGGASWAKLSPFLEFGGGAGRLIALDPSTPGHLFTLGDNQVLETSDGGATWSPALTADGQLSAILLDPAAPLTLYATSYSEGIFKSSDGGATWGSAHDGIRGLHTNNAKAHSVAFDAGAPGTVYAGTIHRGYRSSDGGATWTAMGHPAGPLFAFATHPAAPGVVYAASNDLWRSTDSGLTWANWNHGAFCCFTDSDLVIHPADPQILYLAGRGSASAADGVYKSTDGGLTWSLVNTGLADPSIHVLAIDPNDGNTLYAGTANSFPAALYKTTDGGASWSQLGGGLPTEANLHQVAIHPLDSNRLYLAAASGAGNGVYRSTDGGTSWDLLFNENPNAVIVDPVDVNRVYVGTWNTQGFYRSTDGGDSWALINDGLPINPGIDALALDPSDPSRILAGTAGGVWELSFAGVVPLTVTTLADAGPGSLRDALLQAGQDGVANAIRFDPSLAGGTLFLASPLPDVVEDGTDVDGDVDGDCVPDVAIDGGWMPNANGLNLHSNGNRVAGLAIHSFDCPGCGGDLVVVWGTAGNVVECNHLGTDLSATADLGTRTFGVKVVDGAAGNVIGPGNRILFNGTGVRFENGSSDNVVGPGNEIAWSDGPGVSVVDATSLRNRITGNSLHDNGGLAINLGLDGITENDPGDADVGPNTLLNFPELTAVGDLGGGSFEVSGTAPPDSTVELFAARRARPNAEDPAGSSIQADQFLGATVASPLGAFAFTFSRPAGLFYATATATDAAGNTSELSPALLLTPNRLSVTTLADAGPGSLRDALEQANSDGGPTEITFDPGLAGGTIALLSPLPPLTGDETTLDGDLGGDCVPDVALDGFLTGGADGLDVFSSFNTLRGLAIGRFVDPPGDGILIAPPGHDNRVECTYVGTDLSGTQPRGNGFNGIKISGGTSRNRIGPGNRIAWNGSFGVWVEDGLDSSYPDFSGRFPDFVGAFPAIDLFEGCDTPLQTSGGIVPTDGSGGTFTAGFAGRFSGTLVAGAAGGYTFTFPGLADSARLLLDGAVELEVSGFSGGEDPPAAVTVSLTAGPHLIEVDYLAAPVATTWKLVIDGPGTATLSTDANLGGCAPGQAGLCGELFQMRVPSEGNTILQNSIFDNGGLGISLNCCCGPTANDPGDADVGPNTLLNFPELAAVTDLGGGSFGVAGTAPPGSTVEFFGAAPDPSGFGEGKHFLGSEVAGPDGTFNTTVVLPPESYALTATATDAAGNTSEFSALADAKTPDGASLGDVAGFQGGVVEVPIFVRDLAATVLGIDQPAGNRIQAFAFQVRFSPAAGVAGVAGARAGLTAGLTPLFESTTVAGDTVTWIASFDETGGLVPFTSDAPAPGEVVAKLVVTLDPLAPPSPIGLTLEAAGTTLSNEGGTAVESAGEGTLELFGGSITVFTRAATALYAAPLSSSQVRLTWVDPNAGETGFRVERSPDGASWAAVATVGPDTTVFVDSGLAPATLYYYRVISFSGGGDNPPSNVATAETFPALAAKVCPAQLTSEHTWSRLPAPVRGAGSWAVAYEERVGSTNDEIFFRFLQADGSPAGIPLRLTSSDMLSQLPTARWNGSHFGLLWGEHMRGPGGEITANQFFSLLDGAGQTVRGPVRLFDAAEIFFVNRNLDWAFEWDGGGWGFFAAAVLAPPQSDVAFWRFREDGERLLGPVQLTATPGDEVDVSTAWSGSDYGVAWIGESGGLSEVRFQRLLPDGTQPVGDPGPVLLWQGAPGETALYTSTAWDGAGWAVAWSVEGSFDVAVRLRRVAADGSPLGTVERLSDDFDSAFPPEDGVPVDDEVPVLRARSGGGWVCFTSSFAYDTGSWEIARLEADAAGARVGGRVFVSDVDGAQSIWNKVATDGNSFLVAYDDHRLGTLEVADALVAADGSVAAGPHDLTSGHSPGNTTGLGPSAALPQVAPFQGGFVAVWTEDLGAGSPQPIAQLYDGAGNPTTRLEPLSGRHVRGLPGLAAVGDSFALAWKDGGQTVVFARFDAAGNPLTGEVEIAGGTGGRGMAALAWSGEVYGAAWYEGASLVLQRLDAAGNAVGERTVVSDDVRANPIDLQWLGSGWALVWQAGDNNLRYALVDPFGGLAVAPTPVTSTGAVRFRQHLLWTGEHLGLVWLDFGGLFFEVLNLDGSVAAGPVQVLSDPGNAGVAFHQPRLSWRDGRFHLFRSPPATFFVDGVFEDEILPDGTLFPEVRQLTNRGVPHAVADNGATVALVWNQLREFFVETDACLADATPPACPELTASGGEGAVELAWTPVDDPESGLYRYDLYRDGTMLAELFPGTTAFADPGFRPGVVHGYEVRGLNGAFRESAGCPVVGFSTVGGDGNGDGVLTVADVFYLINFLFAGGPAPAGDADANGDGQVTVADVFYLINFLFGGGPPPAAGIGPPPPGLAPAGPADVLKVGVAAGLPGEPVRVPVYLRDVTGTVLDEGHGRGGEIQGFAFRADVGPAAAVDGVGFEQAGVTAGKTPVLPLIQPAADHVVVLLGFDEAAAPLAWTPDAPAPGDLLGHLVVTLDPAAVPGTVVGVHLAAATAALVSGDARLEETVARGSLTVNNGSVRVLAAETAIFTDGFESGDATAWSRTIH